jgi:hypothetical protein
MKTTYRDTLTGETAYLEDGKLYHSGVLVAETPEDIEKYIVDYDLEEV